MQTLEELRAEVAAEEAKANAAQPEVIETDEVEELEVEAEEAEPEAEETEQAAEEVEGEAEGDEVPEFAKSESDKDKGAVPVAKHVEIKHKLQGKIADKDAEIAELKQKLEQTQAAPAQASEDLEIAKEAWEFDGTTEEYAQYKALLDARNALKLQRSEQQRQANEQRQREESAKVEAELDKHYDRVSALIVKGEVKNLTQPEQYQRAEEAVINSVESVVRGAGKAVLNKMIAELGEGSEKVVFHLGVNAEARGEFENALRADSYGFKAMVYLAKKCEKFNSTPVVKPKPVPKPDVPLQGKAPKVSSYQSAFLKAEKLGDSQAMLAASKAAKAAGINTSNW